MLLRSSTVDSSLGALDQQLASLRATGTIAAAIERLRADASALCFHLRDASERPPIVAILGGTGTGKSTLVNRLLNRDVTAASFRRTFTAGAIAVAGKASNLPVEWLGVAHGVIDTHSLPARGQADQLAVIEVESDLTRGITLIDTPDLDGDQPAHHAQADRVFRWADAIVFLVTPEKYQMTELVPYYRLARRYALPSAHVMNKVEQQVVVEDYQARQNAPVVYAIPRDDANYEPPVEVNLDALRCAIGDLSRSDGASRQEGLRNRCADLFDRLEDQVLAPSRREREEVDRLVSMLRAMESPPVGVDVNPITRQLARRLQQRSILYLIGPGRVLDRVRQVPSLLARLPRTAWDLVMHGKADIGDATGNREARDVPDFGAILSEQLTIVQSRIDDVIRTSPGGTQWIEHDKSAYDAIRIDPSRASAIATDELEQLRAWLETKWNATPRDTAILEKLFKYLPGGKQLTQWSEAAPYLLTIVVATHHAFFGHIDLLILGGYSLATWLTERISNEVASRTKQANRAISDRFERLAHEQIAAACSWLEKCAPTKAELDALRRTAEGLQTDER